MTNKEFYNLADELNITSDVLSSYFDQAHDKLREYAKENQYDCEITVEQGEVYLSGNNNEWFEDNAQDLFYNFFNEIAYK